MIRNCKSTSLCPSLNKDNVITKLLRANKTNKKKKSFATRPAIGLLYTPVGLIGDIPGACNQSIHRQIDRYDIGVDCRIGMESSKNARSRTGYNARRSVKVVYPSCDWFVCGRNDCNNDKPIIKYM